MHSESSVVCIVIVHFGQPEVTKQCLDSLTQLTVRPRVIVSNNDSTEKGKELQKHIDNLGENLNAEVIQNAQNRGFAAGCNVGIRKAMQLKADYVWLLNNDTKVEPGALKALLDCARKHPKTILGATVVEMDRPDIIQVAGGVKYNPWTTVIKQAYAKYPTSMVSRLPDPELSYIAGASMLVPGAIFDTIGLMDEEFFLYYEELDLCLRALQSGFELIWCRDCIVKHFGGATIGTKTGNGGSANQTAAFHESRSTILLTRKHFPGRILSAVLSRALGKLAFTLARRQWSLVPPILKGLVKGLSTTIGLTIRL